MRNVSQGCLLSDFAFIRRVMHSEFNAILDQEFYGNKVFIE
ncbi:hypothetical protein GCM10008986_18590 [Salinibacillus aidingensis]|uniref:Uncharacterized protein n=1 Tax=Salinibacillus aidingensis TaxID=237684 RepID=A0ABP3L3A8_9BACI